MGNIKKQTFLHGALILLLANLTVKIIGFIFRIPIYIILDDIGYANYNDAYILYGLFFTISTAGLPVAISRMISIANAKKNYAEEKKIFKIALISFIAVGTLGTGIMILGARFYCKYVITNNEAYYGILILAPTLFFVCITSAFRGYFQGRQNMVPTAVSEIIEVLGKLFIGVAAAMYALNKYWPSRIYNETTMKYETIMKHGSERLDIVAAFAISGLTVGVLGGSLFLFIRKLLMKNEYPDTYENYDIIMPVRKSRDIVQEIIQISLPIILSSSIVSFSSMIDSAIMKRRLMDIGWLYESAKRAYGAYTGLAIPFFSFPATLIAPIGVTIIPVIAAAFAEKNTGLIKSTVESTFRVTSIIAMPCAFGISCMSRPILNLYTIIKPELAESVESTAPLLSVLAVAAVFVAMVHVTNSMLQSQGQEIKTVISMACGMVVKVVSSYILIGIPSVNRFGTPIGTCLCYLTIMGINFYFLTKYTKITPSVKLTFIKPFIASSVMAISAILSYKIFNYILKSSHIATLAAIIIAVVVYVFLILIQKTLTREDVLLLPKGAKIYETMKKKRLID